MSRNQKIFHQAIQAGCKTAKDLALYIKNNTCSKKDLLLEITKSTNSSNYFSKPLGAIC